MFPSRSVENLNGLDLTAINDRARPGLISIAGKSSIIERCACSSPHRTSQRVLPMTIRIPSAFLVIFTTLSTATWSQEASVSDEIQQGHRLASLICANCHVASPDQNIPPILYPPAPSFESIAQRDNTSIDSVRTFLTTTHRDIRNPDGMPNPQLLDFQIAPVAAYLVSLRRKSGAPAGQCGAEITRLETALSNARANAEIVGSAPESTAARLHRQPTPETVARAEIEAQKKIETTLMVARRLESQSKDAECIAMLKALALPIGAR